MIGDAIKAQSPRFPTRVVSRSETCETREANPGFVELRKISVAKEISSLLSKCSSQNTD